MHLNKNSTSIESLEPCISVTVCLPLVATLLQFLTKGQNETFRVNMFIRRQTFISILTASLK